MKNEKVIICDWGGVIESHEDFYSVFDATISLIRLYTNKYSDNEILKLFNKCRLNKRGKSIEELNNINDIYEWIDRIKNDFKIEVSYDQFLNEYKKTHDLIYSYQKVVEFIKSVNSKCKIGILSNLMYIDKERINKHVNLLDFDYVFLSFEMGVKKPNSNIYLMVQEKLNTDPQNILFIDDTKENIEAAKKIGWNTCQATGKDLVFIKECINNFLS